MDEFKEWLNEEIEAIKDTSSDNNLFCQGKLSEALRIRQTICDMDVKSPGIDREIIEKVAGEICDHYCVFPQAYDTGQNDDNQRMIEERCNKCPVNEVVK